MIRAAKPLSAGLLLYRRDNAQIQVLLAHPGGPIYARKDAGVWSIPKGLVDPDEDSAQAARRECLEEIGIVIPDNASLVHLGTTALKSGKIIHAWAIQAPPELVDPVVLPGATPQNTFELEWPPRSGRRQRFPEIDRAQFFALPEAAEKIHPAQRVFIERLIAHGGLPL